MKCKAGCTQGMFKSGDGTFRCKGCHLYGDMCNCPAEAKDKLIRALGFVR